MFDVQSTQDSVLKIASAMRVLGTIRFSDLIQLKKIYRFYLSQSSLEEKPALGNRLDDNLKKNYIKTEDPQNTPFYLAIVMSSVVTHRKMPPLALILHLSAWSFDLFIWRHI
jgi:hypothetical protein